MEDQVQTLINKSFETNRLFKIQHFDTTEIYFKYLLTILLNYPHNIHINEIRDRLINYTYKKNPIEYIVDFYELDQQILIASILSGREREKILSVVLRLFNVLMTPFVNESIYNKCIKLIQEIFKLNTITNDEFVSFLIKNYCYAYVGAFLYKFNISLTEAKKMLSKYKNEIFARYDIEQYIQELTVDGV